MNQTLAVLITCYNRREKTTNCLRALYSSKLPDNQNFEVFLVDDGSSDGTSDAVRTEFPQVHLIKGDGTLFWNRGMHLAWSTAAKSKNFDYYLWLNDDVELFPEAIKVLLNVASSGDSIVVGNMRSKKEPTLTYGGWDTKGQLIIPSGDPQLCAAFNGNLVLVPRNVFNQLGNLDPFFHHSIGDFDYALRAKKKGIKSYIAPEFSGYCEDHALPPKWCIPEVPFKQRIKSLYSPLGNVHPKYFFKFEKRHYGTIYAVKHLISIHLRLVFPQFWKTQGRF